MKVPSILLSFLVAALLPALAASAAIDNSYAIVVSRETQGDTEWKKVVSKLEFRHPGARIHVWEKSVGEVLGGLQKQFPRHIALVARPAEVTIEFVRDTHLLTRKLDDDPYTDAFWGIITGADAANALQMASESKPLTIRKVASGTEVELDRCESGVWYCELKQGRMVRKEKGGQPTPGKAPADTTEALAKTLTEYQADLFITSGHATERDWQIGYTYKNGFWRSKDGQLYGLDTSKRRIDIISPNPKVYMPIGNCLMGHIDGPDAMALAFLKSAGVRQMLGYVKPTWYGYQGWGCLDYFVEQPGRFTFAEAFFANHHALIHRLQSICPEASRVTEVDSRGRTKTPLSLGPSASALGLGRMDLQGLLFDRDVVVFYGDPAWQAKMAEGTCSWKQELVEKDGSYEFTVTPALGSRSFSKVNKNGAQRGGRPIIQFLPHRIEVTSLKLTSGADRNPVVTDDFILLPLPRESETTPITVKFTAKRIVE